MPTPVATPTPPAQPSGLQAKVDSHPLFSGTTDAAATGQHKPKKVRSRVGRLLVWLLIILIILLPALYVAIDAGLINVGINLPFHIFK